MSAEEYSAKDADGLFGTEAECVSWASTHGWLNGATLVEVLDVAVASGMPVTGQTRRDGPYQSVDWTDYAALCSAVAQGQVKIAVAANQLEAVVGNLSGWSLLAASADHAIDHCVGLAGYGTLAECCSALGVAVPAGTAPATPCLILFTWGTYGVVSHAALLGISPPADGEAWVRVPTTVGISPAPPAPPTPTPPSPPAPVPAGPTLAQLTHAIDVLMDADGVRHPVIARHIEQLRAALDAEVAKLYGR